jgi:hypothetical protein
MSLTKLVPDGLKPQGCERLRLHEPPPVPYVPKKDEVQGAVSSMKGLQLKTLIDKDTTLNFFVWNSGTKEAMLMHVMATLDAIKKRGCFKAYKEAQALYVEKKEVVKSAKASLSLLDGASKGSGKSKKTLTKAKEAKGVTEAPNNPKQLFKQTWRRPSQKQRTPRAQ